MIFPVKTKAMAITAADMDDLDMPEIVLGLAMAKGNEDDAHRFLTEYLCCDRDELVKRQEIIQILSSNSDAENKLTSFIQKAELLRQRVNRLTSDRTGSLLSYYTTGRLMLSGFLELYHDVKSFVSAQDHRSFVETTQYYETQEASQAFQYIQAANDRISSHDLILRSIDIGINTNQFLEMDDFGIISFNHSSNRTSCLFATGAGNTSISGDIKFPRTGNLLHLEAHFRSAFERKHRSMLSAIRRVLDKVHFALITEFAAQLLSLELYVSALHLIRRFNHKNISLCIPQYDKTALSASGMLYPQLALLRDDIVPLSVAFSKGCMVLVTGANHSGKTSFLKATAQCLILAHMGLPVPAEFFSTPVFSQVMTLFSAGEKNYSNKSRYQLELEKIKHMYENAHSDTLILLNEPLTSTNPDEAVGILGENITHLAGQGCTVITVTHLYDIFHVLKKSERAMKSFVTCTQLDGKTLQYTYTIRESPPLAQNYAHIIAQQYGLTAEQLLQNADQINRINQYLSAKEGFQQ